MTTHETPRTSLPEGICPFGSAAMIEDPFPFFDHVRSTEPVYEIPGRGTFLLTRREEVEYAFLHPEIFSNQGRTPGRTYPGQRYETIPDLASTDPPEHKPRRALYLDLIGARRIAVMKPVLEAKAHELIDAFVDQPEVGILGAYAKPLPAWVMGWILGVDESMHEQLDVWAGEYFDLFDSNLHGDGDFEEVERRLIPSFVAFTNFCGDLVTSWREDPDVDEGLRKFASSTKEDGTPFSVDELTNEVRLMVVGAQTTANLIAQSLIDVIENGRFDELGDEKAVGRIVDESLRKDGPATHIPRICTQDVELAGVKIPAGSRVFLSIQAANRDESYYGCPARFDTDRDNLKRHFAFGFGTHHCVGAPIARVEAATALIALGERFRSIRLSPRNDYTHRTELTALRALNEVHVELERA